ncbi:PilN domain-containing protein [Bradyrhizobium sp. HKCCYLS20291]|uniref:PilN domain-containing protein n=1 Tax=Bradyrhizobium sp. HKCCYLS20291 TaxID=3420766 RepID=UPI003EBA9E07
MTMIAELRRQFADWIGTVAETIVRTFARLDIKPPIQLIETERNLFVVRTAARSGRSAAPDCQVRLTGDAPGVAPLHEHWQAAMRGSRVELMLLPDRFLTRPLDLPRRAVEFLDAMIRSQVDRLTPWAADDAVFGYTSPAETSGDRISTTVIATPKTTLEPLIRMVESWRAGSIVLFASREPALPPANGQLASDGVTKLMERHFRGSLDAARVSRVLTAVLLAAAAMAALSMTTMSMIGGGLEEQERQLTQKISERRAALRLEGGDTTALTGLVRRKQQDAASVVLLEALSRILPDNTYVTELRIDNDKLHMVGMTQDAPALIKVLEQSPHFTHATFFAPTTRSADQAGERFHIEAAIKPHSGLGI